MKFKRLKNELFNTVLIILILIMVIIDCKAISYARDSDGAIVVVSMGDSYSSGEGIDPFYGQYDSSRKELPLSEKVKNEDWLAHRSENSWPGMLKIPGVEGTLKEYKVDSASSNKLKKCKWYFVASSGATTQNIKEYKVIDKLNTGRQIKLVDIGFIEHIYYVQNQINIFNQSSLTNINIVNDSSSKNLGESVDYVTLTIGGNDVRFADIIKTCAMKSTYLHHTKQAIKALDSDSVSEGIKKLTVPTKLQHDIKELRDNFNFTRKNIKQTYKDIHNAAPNAQIIVAGYPRLLETTGKGAAISAEEARIVNNNVSWFNSKIEEIVNECQKEGISIIFVGVEKEFEGHEAYTEDPWIKEIILKPKSQDLKQLTIGSAYSVHPNDKGAKAYARCVNRILRNWQFGKVLEYNDSLVYSYYDSFDYPTINIQNISTGDISVVDKNKDVHIASNIVIIDNDLYYVGNRGISKYNLISKNKKIIFEKKSAQIIGYENESDCIYFIDDNNIYSYNIISEKYELIIKLESAGFLTEEGGNIYYYKKKLNKTNNDLNNVSWKLDVYEYEIDKKKSFELFSFDYNLNIDSMYFQSDFENKDYKLETNCKITDNKMILALGDNVGGWRGVNYVLLSYDFENRQLIKLSDNVPVSFYDDAIFVTSNNCVVFNSDHDGFKMIKYDFISKEYSYYEPQDICFMYDNTVYYHDEGEFTKINFVTGKKNVVFSERKFIKEEDRIGDYGEEDPFCLYSYIGSTNNYAVIKLNVCTYMLGYRGYGYHYGDGISDYKRSEYLLINLKENNSN